MRVLVTGDRNYTNREAIRACLLKLTDEGYTVLIEGEARGADTLAREEAEKLGYTIKPYPAKWSEHGMAAGPIRNRQMVKEGKPDLVVYFHHDLASSKGTRDMVNHARSRKINIPVRNGEE